MIYASCGRKLNLCDCVTIVHIQHICPKSYMKSDNRTFKHVCQQKTFYSIEIWKEH